MLFPALQKPAVGCLLHSKLASSDLQHSLVCLSAYLQCRSADQFLVYNIGINVHLQTSRQNLTDVLLV